MVGLSLGRNSGSGGNGESNGSNNDNHHLNLLPSGRFARNVHGQKVTYQLRSEVNHISLPHASLSWDVESPPIILLGTPNQSTGALVSGQLCLTVNGDHGSCSSLVVGALRAWVGVRVRHQRPFHRNCADCTSRVTVLKQWDLFPRAKTLTPGRHQFPFSILLGGHLPATLDSPLVSISYEFCAEVFPFQHPGAPVPISPIARLERDLLVRRSVSEAGSLCHSARMFPPTSIRADVYHSHILHPASSGKLLIRLTGLSSTSPAIISTSERYMVRRVSWCLEEIIRTVAPACTRHLPKGSVATGLVRTETSILAKRAYTAGWMESVRQGESCVDFEVPFSLYQTTAPDRRPAFDLNSSEGTKVTHALVVEIVVASGWAHATSAGRVLRANYPVVITDSPGDGISWDNECPPVYQDVPPSPPDY